MKPTYAFNSFKELITISQVDKNLRGKYLCINCNGVLIPKKGKIRAHHFAHKAESNCSYETYLHKVAKLKFYEQYNHCLNNKQPFYFEKDVTTTCISCINVKPYNTMCDLGTTIKPFDLTKVYDKVYIEKQKDGFIADILLVSTRYKICLFIEFVVTHFCEQSKIDSSNSIIEIKLNSELDLSFVDNKYISKKDENITYYNISAKEIKGDINEYSTCEVIFESFIVFKSGKSIISRDTLFRTNYRQSLENYLWFVLLAEINKETNCYYKVTEDFQNLVRYAIEEGINIKNCFGCRFYAYNNRYNRMYDIFCKKYKAEIENSNVAADCKSFWKIEINQ